MIVERNVVKSFIYLFLYKIFLDVVYIEFVYAKFNYMGFILEFSLYKYIFSLCIFVLTYITLPKKQDKPSLVFLQLHFIVMIIPMFTIYAFMNQPTIFLIMSIFIFILQCVFVRYFPNIQIRRIEQSKLIFYVIIIGMTLFVYTSMIKANGLPSLSSLNIMSVYEFRGKVTYPFLMAYFVNWQAKVINPFLIATSFLNENRIIFCISVILQILIYMITGHKAFLFIPIAILLVVILIARFNFLKISSFIASGATFILFILYKVTGTIILPSLFLRRLLFLPAYIKFIYYDFFLENQFLYFSAGSIGKLLGLSYPFDLPPAYLIGKIYFNNPNTGANTGYIADAYANMGFGGMVLLGLVFAFVLKLIDSLSIKVGKNLTIGLTLFTILSLNDSALLTTLLTGGLLFLIVMLYLYSNVKDKRI
ncbi:MAG: hypothetical protein ACERKZ_04070 [Lachnotalea sp.]